MWRTGRAALPPQVRIERLDSILTSARHKGICFAKIDVQGGELPVLRGALRLLQSHSIGALIFEWTYRTELGFLMFSQTGLPKGVLTFCHKQCVEVGQLTGLPRSVKRSPPGQDPRFTRQTHSCKDRFGGLKPSQTLTFCHRFLVLSLPNL